MNAIAPSLLQRIRQDLLVRQRALRNQLRAAAEGDGTAWREVHDQKDVAAEESRLVVDDATQAHVIKELASTAAALRHLDDGSYGLCQNCGEPIAEGRLLAMPAAALCSDCQRQVEAATHAR
jgi:DnaK suppressor protein